MLPEHDHTSLDRRTFLGTSGLALGVADTAEPLALPAGVKAVWDLEKAHREKTPTRERVCLNGLWRWQPVKERADTVPADAWGYFKVPAFWPGTSSYIQEVGLEQAEARTLLPFAVETKKGEHIAAYFEPPRSFTRLVGVGPADVHICDSREVPLVTGGAEVLGNGVLARVENTNVVFCQLLPWQFEQKKSMNLKRTFRRVSALLTRLAANMGASAATPVLGRVNAPVKAGEQRWLDGFHLDVPEEWDDPYRFFRW